MDRLDAMHVMLTAVECGSLSKASRKLGQPLATVSRKVSELESHLKADLLIRSSKGLELTPAGRTYITSAKTILEQLNEAERAAAGEYTEPKGDLVVTAPIMFGRLHVLPVVTTFLTAFPEVSVELMLTDRVTHFLDDQVDVALRIGDLPDSSRIATRLGAVRRVTCASPAYLASRAALAVPQDLADHDVISFGSVSSPTTWRYWSDGNEVAVPLRSRLERQHHRRGDRCGPGRRGGDQEPCPTRSPTMCATTAAAAARSLRAHPPSGAFGLRQAKPPAA
jgi:DNA-binding transcriptional LysR family regulator